MSYLIKHFFQINGNLFAKVLRVPGANLLQPLKISSDELDIVTPMLLERAPVLWDGSE